MSEWRLWRISERWKTSVIWGVNRFGGESKPPWTEQVTRRWQPYLTMSPYTKRWPGLLSHCLLQLSRSSPNQQICYDTSRTAAFDNSLKWWELGESRVGFLTTAVSSCPALLVVLQETWEWGPPCLLAVLVLVELVLSSSWQRPGKVAQNTKTFNYQNNPCNYPWSWLSWPWKSVAEWTKACGSGANWAYRRKRGPFA